MDHDGYVEMTASLGDGRPVSSSPVPSITLQVSRNDAKQFMKVSNVIAAAVVTKFPKHSSVGNESSTNPLQNENNSTTTPLHEMLFQAASDSNDEAVIMYKNRLRASPLSQLEGKASFVLFHKAEFDEKLKVFFEAFSSTGKLNRSDLLSFFRTLLTSITFCCGTESSGGGVVERDQSPSLEPPLKKMKRENTDYETRNRSPGRGLFFDGESLKDENKHELPKEIEDVAVFGTDHVLSFAKEKSLETASAHILMEWYSDKGKYVAPWLELLSISKWKAVANQGREMASPASSDKEDRRVSDEHHVDQVNFNKDTLFDEPFKSESISRADDNSKSLVSFDFSGSGHPKPLCIEISENNLFALRHFVHRTGLMHCPASAMCKKLLRLAHRRTSGSDSVLTLSRDVWMDSIGDIIGREVWGQLSSVEREAFSGCFTEIFSCFEGNKPLLKHDEVDLQEFAVGFCFFCSGNKSSKLA
ncbi:hypothetical protein ACA910_002815, partial [Epithemia clementina (nom. ined.)]